MPLTLSQRTPRAKLAAHTLHGQGGTNTAPARAAFDQRFIDQALAADPTLESDELNKRVRNLRSAYFTKLASSRRRPGRGGRDDHDP